MPTIEDLTEAQFVNLLEEYYAPPKARNKLTEAEVKDLASKLNDKVNIPLISETREEKILIKVILRVDTFLYDNLPNEIYDLVRSSENGIEDEEATRLINRLSILANEKINIPYIPEAAEYVAIKFVIRVVINAARKNWNFDRAKAASDKDLIIA
ncbi:MULTISPECIES: hypothetical protein [Pseudoalteromonas]|uniref:hypothetical protein n=1 Tax=Pseudoalteromonas TaxID=53246 RepID=UPI0006CA1D62|nr:MULTISPECIES: hypothetical protein [Pseudoalteromonas]KPM79252.1 hypothetical protein AOG26_07265 [Pseudoalteromonas sp. UCD-33C]MDK9682516.1 hypothetical protein [Pseudoalteromonas shioyasakiensis]